MMTSQFAATIRMFLSTMAASFSHLTELPLVRFMACFPRAANGRRTR
jgi:hypothetical protein